jgi:hypothetical protein
MLVILLATCERALEVFAEAEAPVPRRLVEELEAVAVSIRQEIGSRPRPYRSAS